MSNQLPKAVLDNYEQVLGKLSEQSRKKLEKALKNVDWSSYATAKEQMTAIFQELAGASTDIAAQLGANFYDTVSKAQTGEVIGANAYNTYDPSYSANIIGSKVTAISKETDLFKQEQMWEELHAELLRNMDNQIRKSANSSCMHAGYKDKRRPKFARVPQSPKPCMFCLMLASRGAVYYSRKTAGELNEYHQNCSCKAVPVFNDNGIQGYDPDVIYDTWQDEVDTMAKERAERNGTSVEEETKAYYDRMKKAAITARERNGRYRY